MKFAILLLPVILFSACDKAEEKPASPVTPQGPDSKRMVPDSGRRTAILAGTVAPAQEVAMISSEEIQTFTGKADELAQRWDAFLKLPADQQTDEALNTIRSEHQVLVVERGKFLKGFTAGQRKEHTRRLIGSVSKVGSGILTYGLNKRRSRLTRPTLHPPLAPGAGDAPPPVALPQENSVPEDVQPVPQPDNSGGVPDNAP